jgi:hypothetical protein
MGAAMLTEPSLTVGLLHRTATAPDATAPGATSEIILPLSVDSLVRT